MLLILIHKVLEIKLNIIHPVYWDENKVKLLLLVLRLTCFVMIVATMLAYNIYDFHYEKVYTPYLATPLIII